MKIYKVKTKKAKNKLFMLCFAFFLCFCLIIAYIHFVVDPVIVKAVYAQIDSMATTKVSDAIYDVIKKSNLSYDELVTINYDSNHRVTSIITNSINLNVIARDVSTFAQKYIDDLADEGVQVPFGTFSGIPFFAGKGHKFNLKLVPIGSLITNFKSDFISAGINQTLHSLSIVVNVSIAVILPMKTQNINFTTDMVICENLIVGEIPEVYLSSKLI